MADNLLALQVQPTPSIGPVLSSVYDIRQKQAQTALTTAEAGRQAGLTAALQSGDPDKVRQYDPTAATAMLTYNNSRDAYGLLRSPTGDAALKGDPTALATLSRIDPTVGNLVRTGLSTAATTAKTYTETDIANLNLMSQYANRALALPPGDQRDAFVLGAPIPPELKTWYSKASSEEKQNFLIAGLAGSEIARNHAAETLYKPTPIPTDQPSIVPGTLLSTTGVPQGPQGSPNPLTPPASGPQAAAAGPAGPSTSTANPLAPAGAPAPGANLLAAPAPSAAPSVPTPTPAPAGPSIPPDIQAKVDERRKTLVNEGLDPNSTFFQTQLSDYQDLLMRGSQQTPSPAPVPKLPVAPAAVPTPVPPAAAAATGPSAAPTPVPAPAAAPAPTLGGLPTSPTLGGGVITGGGPAYTGIQKSQADELQGAASVQNQQKQQVLQSQTSAMLDVLKNADTQTGFGAQEILQLRKAQQLLYSMLGVNDPALNADISNPESFAKFATLAAATIAKQDVGARVTNFDLATFMQNQPGLGTSLQGNQRLLGITDQVNARNQEISKLAQDAVNSNSGWSGWSKAVGAWQDAHPIVDSGTGEVLTTSSPDSKNPVKRGDFVKVAPEDLANGVLDNTYHLLPGAQVVVNGKTYTYSGATTGKPGVTAAAPGAR